MTRENLGIPARDWKVELGKSKLETRRKRGYGLANTMSTPVEALRGKRGLEQSSDAGGVTSEVACRICSSEKYEPFLEARGFRIVQCKNCGLWFVNPQPTAEELAQFYASYDDGEQWRFGEKNFNRGVRKAILRFKREGAVLDIGCGSGNFLRCMREAGFSVAGIEPSKTGSKYGETVQGIEIFNGMVEEYLIENAGRRFDVVTLLNVLEHLTDPKGTLLKLKELMAPDAVLAVVVPDARFHALLGRVRRTLRLSDPYWLGRNHGFLSGFKLPDHLTSFGPHTISLLLQRCGFRIGAIQNAPVVWNGQPHRNAAKLLVRSVFGAVQYATLGRLLFGYSTLVVALIGLEGQPDKLSSDSFGVGGRFGR